MFDGLAQAGLEFRAQVLFEVLCSHGMLRSPITDWRQLDWSERDKWGAAVAEFDASTTLDALRTRVLAAP